MQGQDPFFDHYTDTDIGFERLLARERVWNISKITKARPALATVPII